VTTFNTCTACNFTDLAGEFGMNLVADPYCTGDSPDEIELTCPKCHSTDVEWDVVVCDGCEAAEPVEGYDDCATCILLDQYSHNKIYDATDREFARSTLTDSERCAIDDRIADTIDRGRA
jgi:hypothetical protein